MMLTFAYSLEPSSYNIIASVSEGATGQALSDGSQRQEAPNDGIVDNMRGTGQNRWFLTADRMRMALTE